MLYICQANHLRPPAPSSSSVPVARLGGTAGLGPSKFTYRYALVVLLATVNLHDSKLSCVLSLKVSSSRHHPTTGLEGALLSFGCGSRRSGKDTCR